MSRKKITAAEVLEHSAGFRVRLTKHYLITIAKGRLRRNFVVDYKKAYAVGKRWKNRVCLARVQGYQVIFKWDTKAKELIFITILAPGHFSTRPVVRVLL